MFSMTSIYLAETNQTIDILSEEHVTEIRYFVSQVIELLTYKRLN